MPLQWKRATHVEGYVSTDGAWTIEKQEAYTFCDNPHPMGKGKPRCEGGEEHPYTLWVLWRDEEGAPDARVDAGPTLSAMKDSAEISASKKED